MEKVLPEDIILDIFSRVPFESVSECRLVSKTWKYFISHLTKIKSSDSKVSFISLNMLHNSKFQLLYLEYDDETQQQLRISKINHPPIWRPHYKLIRFGEPPDWKIKNVIIGSSNGLICLSIPRERKFGAIDDPLCICNPVTGEYIVLPICSQKLLRGRNVFGFGYNDKTNEYKVVRIYYRTEKHTERGQVYVYTLGAGTGWRSKGQVAHSIQTNNSYSPGMNADGEVYWLHQGVMKTDRVPGEMIRSDEGRVVAFNLADEVFRLLPQPPYHITMSNGHTIAIFLYRKIQVLGGSLCYIHKAAHDTINIWSFKKRNGNSGCSFKENEEDSSNWSLAATVHLYHDNLAQFFDLTKSGEVLYWDDKTTAASYDPRTAGNSRDFLYRNPMRNPGIKHLLGHGTTAGLEMEIFETIRHERSFVSLKALGEENVEMFDRINLNDY